MNDAVVDKIIVALQLLHNPATLSEQRIAAHEFCEQFKSNPQSSVQYVPTLCKHNEPIVAHFGCHVLEHTVRTLWYSLSQQERSTLVQIVVQLFESPHDIFSEPHFMKEKIVSLMTDVARREWPQHWPNMIEKVITVAQKGLFQRELSLLLLRNLAEDTKNCQEIGDRRRRDMIVGIQNDLHSILSFIHEVLQQIPPPNSTQNEILAASYIFNAALDALLPYYEILSSEDMSKFDFLPTLIKLLPLPAFRNKIGDIFLVFALRKNSPDERYNSTKLLETQNFAVLSQSVRESASLADENSHKFVCRIAQVICIVGLNLIALIEQNQLADKKFEYTEILSMFLSYLSHPSLIASSFVIPFWNSALHSSKLFSKIPILNQMIPQILQTCFVKLLKSEPTQTECAYLNFDYDSVEDYEHEKGLMRSSQKGLIKRCAFVSPDVTLNFTLSSVLNALNNLTPTNKCELERSVFMLSSAFSAFYGDQLTMLRESKFSNNTQELIETTKKVFLEIKHNNDPFLMRIQLSGIKATCLFFTDSISIQKALEIIVNACQFLPQTESLQHLSETTVETRRKGTTVFVRMALTISHSLSPFLSALNEWVISRVDNEFTLAGESVALREALTAISNGLSCDEQVGFLTQSLTPFLDRIGQFQNVVSSPSSFSQYMLGKSEDQSVVKKRRLHFYNFVYTAVCVWRRVLVREKDKSPFWALTQLSERLCSFVLSTIRCLHLLYASQDSEWISVAMGAYGAFAERERKKATTAQENIAFILENIREWSYSILGFIVKKSSSKTICSAITAQNLLSSVFCGLEHIENRQLTKLMTHFIKPFSLSCPPNVFENVLSPCLSVFTKIVTEKVIAEWNKFFARENDNIESKPTKENESVEIASDNVLRKFSRGYVSWLSSIVMINEKHETAVLRRQFLLDSSSDHIMKIAVTALSFPDSTTMRKALKMCIKLFPYYCNRPDNENFHALIIHYCVQGLHHNVSAEFVHDFCVLMRESILHCGSKALQLLCNQLPFVKQEIIEGFLSSLASQPEKKQLSLCKSFFTDKIHHHHRKADHIQNISTLAVFLARVNDNIKPNEESLGLDQIFG